MDYQKIVPIIEAYPCLQSEGKLTGIPHLLIRTTGCTLRCQFSETDFCDSWYTSWSPEKGEFSLDAIIAMYKKYPQIKHTMITGGSPTMHTKLLQQLCHIGHSFSHHITLETEGSKFVPNCNIDLLSLSPKLTNSTPIVGTTTPAGKIVSEKDKKRHNSKRENYKAMQQWIDDSKDYQLKPVISSNLELQEVDRIQFILNDIPNNKVWLMPAGGTAKELEKHRVWLMEMCWEKGYNYTDRIHIVAYGDKRGV